MNTKEKLKFSILLILTMLLSFISASVFTAAAEPTYKTLEELDFSMVKGASVRLVQDSNGVRFSSALPTSEYISLMENPAYSNIEFGMIIVPNDYEEQHGEITEENVFGESAVYYWDVSISEEEKLNKKQIINLVSDRMIETTECYRYNAAITNILTKNLTREFLGVGYIKAIEAETNIEKYLFAERNENIRSIVYIAQRALESSSNLTEQNEAVLNNYITIATQNESKFVYSVEHSLEKSEQTYELEDIEIMPEQLVNTEVSAIAKEYEGYVLDETVASTVKSGKVYANGKLVLKLYYKAAPNQNGEYKVTYNLNGGVLSSPNPTTYREETPSTTLNNPVREGYNFVGWYNDNDVNLSSAITTIGGGATSNLELQAVWQKPSILEFTTEQNGDFKLCDGGMKKRVDTFTEDCFTKIYINSLTAGSKNNVIAEIVLKTGYIAVCEKNVENVNLTQIFALHQTANELCKLAYIAEADENGQAYINVYVTAGTVIEYNDVYFCEMKYNIAQIICQTGIKTFLSLDQDGKGILNTWLVGYQDEFSVKVYMNSEFSTVELAKGKLTNNAVGVKTDSGTSYLSESPTLFTVSAAVKGKYFMAEIIVCSEGNDPIITWHSIN